MTLATDDAGMWNLNGISRSLVGGNRVGQEALFCEDQVALRIACKREKGSDPESPYQKEHRRSPCIFFLFFLRTHPSWRTSSPLRAILPWLADRWACLCAALLLPILLSSRLFRCTAKTYAQQGFCDDLVSLRDELVRR